MNKESIERILRLQKGAYELLIWIDRRAEQEPELLSDDTLAKWRYPESCEVWVRAIHGMIPQAIRPALDEIPAFARLFTSFFQTSFHVVENVPILTRERYFSEPTGRYRRKLVAGPPAGKKSSQGKERVKDEAHQLRLLSLEELALEHELFPSREQLEKVALRPSLQPALTLWTYVLELHRRATFASQGEAVRSLWLSMDKQQRESIQVEKVLNARITLLAHLKVP